MSGRSCAHCWAAEEQRGASAKHGWNTPQRSVRGWSRWWIDSRFAGAERWLLDVNTQASAQTRGWGSQQPIDAVERAPRTRGTPGLWINLFMKTLLIIY